MFSQFSQLKEDSLRHLADAGAFAEELKLEKTAARIDDGRRHLADCRYNIAIVGDMNRGKSTLINVLLGRSDDSLSPVSAKVCTSSIIHYLGREAHPEGKSEAHILYEGGGQGTVPVESLHEYITEAGNPGNGKKVRSVDVYGDFPLLRNAVTLVDTPGRGAVYRHHEILVEDFLPLADAIVFLVAMDLPVTASEYEFLEMLGEQEKERIFFVLTKRDEVPDKDIDTVRTYVKSQITRAGLVCDRLYEISAKPVFEALKGGAGESEIQQLRQAHGLSALERDLEDFIVTKSEKNSVFLPRLGSYLEYLECFYRQQSDELSGEVKLYSMGEEKIRTEIERVEKASVEMNESFGDSLKRFNKGWTRDVEKFCRSFEGRIDPVVDKTLQKLGSQGLIAMAGKTLQASRLIEKEVGIELQALLPDLDRNLSDHVRSLSEEIDADWASHFSPRTKGDAVLPIAGIVGMAGPLVAVGFGVTKSLAALTAWAAVAGSAATQGGVAALWASIAGGGAVATGTAAAIAATTPAVIAVAAVYGASLLAKQILLAAQQNKIPDLVESTTRELLEKMRRELDRRRQEIEDSFSSALEETIDAQQRRLRELQRKAAEADPGVEARLEADIERIRKLEQERSELARSLRLL